MPSHCTLQGARRQALVTPTTVTDDAIAADYIAFASQAVDDYCGRYFEETQDAFGFNGEIGKYNPTLSLRDRSLISIQQITNGDGSLLVPGNYSLLPFGQYPKDEVRINIGNYWVSPNQTNTNPPAPPPLLNDGYAEDVIQITGTWGFNRNYNNAWQLVPLTVSGAHSAAQTTLNLSGIPGALLDVGSVIRISNANGTEWLNVVGPISSSAAASGGLNVAAVTVVRNYNNRLSTSMAIALNGGESIYVWRPEPSVELATRMIVAALYKGRENATGDRMIVADLGAISVPVDIPLKAKALLRYPLWSHVWGQVG